VSGKGEVSGLKAVLEVKPAGDAVVLTSAGAGYYGGLHEVAPSCRIGEYSCCHANVIDRPILRCASF
jgi:hypothetical protein